MLPHGDDAVDGKKCMDKNLIFIPEYEFPGVSAALKGFDKFFFLYAIHVQILKNKDDILERLNILADSYGKWIDQKLILDEKMSSREFKDKIGDKVVSHCREALDRIREGISLITGDEIAFDAFLLYESLHAASEKY